MNDTVKAHIALFSVALIYGANYTIAKEVLDNDYLQPFGFILMRVAAGCLLFWIFHTIMIREQVERRDFGLLALCGLTGIAVNQMMFFLGLKHTYPINASLIMTTVPMVVIIIASIMGDERWHWKKIAGILIGAAGAILLILRGSPVQMDQSTALGDLYILINATSYSIYLVLVRRLMQKYNPFTVLKWIFSFGLLYVLPFGGPELVGVDWSSFSTSIWLAIIYVLIFTTFFAYMLNAYALTTVSSTVAGAYIYLQPLVAATIALALGKDMLTSTKAIAGIMIFAGVYLVTSQVGRSEK